MAGIMMIFPESFTPPDDLGATAGSRPPPWIFLDLDAYIADRRNATTATATSRQGLTVQVTLCAADPPAMSYLCVHSPSSKSGDTAFASEPRVVGAEGRFALLRICFAQAVHNSDEYFMYRADPDSPSLERVGRPAHRMQLFGHLAVVPLGDGGGGRHYLLVGRTVGSSTFKPTRTYELHIYSSAAQAWSVKPLPAGACPVGGHADKVIPLGDGVVGWVDLRVRVAVCDLLREPPDVRFIPLPVPMPGNRKRLTNFHPGDPAWRFRDVAYSSSNGGVLKFVEIEHRWIVTTIAPEEPADPREEAVLLDSELITSMRKRMREVDTRPRQVRKRDGWSMVTWSRPAMSSDCWRKGRVIDVDDVTVDDTIASTLRSGGAAEVADDEHDESFFKFRNMVTAFPTLSTDVDDLVYLKSVWKATDPRDKFYFPKGWMVALDLGKKTLTALAPYSFGRHDPCTYNDRLCSLSNYLNMDPDLSQTRKLKDSADPLKTRQSGADEEDATCPYKEKPRDQVRGLMELKAQEGHHCSIKEEGAGSNEERSSRSSDSSSSPLSPPASQRTHQPRAVIKQPDGVARPTGSSLLPQLPVPPQHELVQWSGAHAGNHPNAHAVTHHHLHDATGFSRSCPPPPPQPVVLPQQIMSHWNGGVSYLQNHPWPPPPHQQYVAAQAQQWNNGGVAVGYQGQQQQPYTHGVDQNHWNAAAAGYYYYCPPSANVVNLQQNQWDGVGYYYSSPNLPGQFSNLPGVVPERRQ